jgi:hypothetical protein
VLIISTVAADGEMSDVTCQSCCGRLTSEVALTATRPVTRTMALRWL